MKTKTALKAAFQRHAIEGKIRGLVAKLHKLAPHPDRPEFSGALFVSVKSQFNPPAEYEGMMGSVMMDGLLGSIFNGIANDNSSPLAPMATSAHHLDIDTIAEMLSEFLVDRERRAHAAKKGQGTFALGEHKTICNVFNTETGPDGEAYAKDLKKRQHIESTVEGLTRKYFTLKRKELEPCLVA